MNTKLNETIEFSFSLMYTNYLCNCIINEAILSLKKGKAYNSLLIFYLLISKTVKVLEKFLS